MIMYLSQKELMYIENYVHSYKIINKHIWWQFCLIVNVKYVRIILAEIDFLNLPILFNLLPETAHDVFIIGI